MAYSQITFAQAKTQLAGKLNDAAKVFWSDTELGLYIKEALAIFNAAANYWTQVGVFTTTAGVMWYDLTLELPALLGNTTTDTDVVTVMQYQLLEPPTPTAWSGTEMFTLADLTAALTRRRNQFLEDTGIHITLPVEIASTPADNGIIQLSQDVLQVRRVAWKAPDSNGNLDATHGTFTQLPRTDSFAANAQLPGWSVSPATPEFYIPYFTTPITTLQLAPVPIDIGRVEVAAVNAGADLDPATSVAMGLNDDFIPYVRYGALADLLNREGMSADPQRASYCEQRYREGVELGKLTFTMTQAKVNGVPVPMMAMDDFDYQIAGWQNDVGEPEEVAAGNSTLIALHPIPDDIYSIEVAVIQNAVLPASDGEYLQVDAGVLDVILGYAQHAACFKLGGQEFMATMPLYAALMQMAAQRSQVLQSNMANFDILNTTAVREQQLRPAGLSVNG